MSHPRPFPALFAGVAAADAMAAFRSLAGGPFGQDDGDDDPATAQAADALAKATTGRRVADTYRAQAGQAVHYLTGAALGGLVRRAHRIRTACVGGVRRRLRPRHLGLAGRSGGARGGAGVRAMGYVAAIHACGASAHLVFGVALEGVRALLGRRQG